MAIKLHSSYIFLSFLVYFFFVSFVDYYVTRKRAKEREKERIMKKTLDDVWLWFNIKKNII